MRINRKLEDNLASSLWRFAIGPAQLLDGVVSICTLTFIYPGFALWTSRQLAKSRLTHLLKGRE